MFGFRREDKNSGPPSPDLKQLCENDDAWEQFAKGAREHLTNRMLGLSGSEIEDLLLDTRAQLRASLDTYRGDVSPTKYAWETLREFQAQAVQRVENRAIFNKMVEDGHEWNALFADQARRRLESGKSKFYSGKTWFYPPAFTQDEAHDIVLETYMAARAAQYKFEGNSHPTTYLEPILGRKAINVIKKNVRRRQHEAPLNDLLNDDDDDGRGGWTKNGRSGDEWLVDPALPPGLAAEYEELIERYLAAIREIRARIADLKNPHYPVILDLLSDPIAKDMHAGNMYDRISELTGVKENSVSGVVQNARTQGMKLAHTVARERGLDQDALFLRWMELQWSLRNN